MILSKSRVAPKLNAGGGEVGRGGTMSRHRVTNALHMHSLSRRFASRRASMTPKSRTWKNS
eukprot:363873-Chlamydomonas_euryale.AAC.12